nr:hypothetical protein [Tanacetum cinerariifolium]
MVPHEAFACSCEEGDVVLRQSYKPESFDDGIVKPLEIELSLPNTEPYNKGCTSEAEHSCIIDTFIIATNRQLSVLHPIFKLLQLDFHDTMNINALGTHVLINARGVLEMTVFPAPSSYGLLQLSMQQSISVNIHMHGTFNRPTMSRRFMPKPEILSKHSTDEIYLGQNESSYWDSDGKALEAFEEFRKKLISYFNNV